jgi:TDG/mug DNA glycosylase family protein
LFSPDEDARLLEQGIGLTDLVKTRSGLDRDLAHADYDAAGLEAKIELHAPKVIAFDSLNAGRRALGTKAQRGLQKERFGGAEVFVLPSTSGLASGHWDIGPWRELAAHLGRGVS